MATPTAHVFHVAQLRELADGKSYARGEAYHREGRVSALRRDGKTIAATVAGSTPYEVKLWVAGDRIAYTCSCPMGEVGVFCKHCVAVALGLIEQLGDAAPAPARDRDIEDDAEDHAEHDEVDDADESEPEDDEPADGATVIVAPDAIDVPAAARLFLAGSIDMDEAPRWQDEIIEALADLDGVAIFNPRRADWDHSWEQSLADERFVEQVEWELEALERADVIAVYFAPASKAPVTLLELGLHAASGKLVVCCPEGYWRKGNVDVVCRRLGVHQVHDFNTFARALRARLRPLTARET